MLKPISVGALGLVAFLVGACGSSSPRETFDDGTPPGDGTGATGGPVGTGPIGGKPAGENPTADECQKMDIVFVVDDSGSMEQEQSNLATNFPKFVSVLEGFKTKSGAKLDYRLAVTTTGRDIKYSMEVPGFGSIPADEKGDNGAFKNTKSCGESKRWVDRADMGGASRFACLAKAGTSGPSIEMPLYALKLALNDRVADGTNKGFLRDDALLAVVVLSDEDDCSREDNNFTIQNDVCSSMANVHPVKEYADMLDVAAKGPGRWATAVIAGDKKCTSSFGDAVEAKRLKDFVAIAGKNGTFSSICDGDLSGALQKALDTFDAACKSFPPVR
jgi:hypothetical protein